MRTRLSATVASVAAALVLLACVATARAEVVELLDKTKMTAKVIHYYDGVYTLETGGNTVKVPREKIRAITFQLPPSRAEFSTPEKTFERWRKSMVDGDIEKMIDCYALMYQGFLAYQMGHAGDEAKKQQKDLAATKFEIKGSSLKGETATLKVQRKHGEDSDTGEIAFVKENGEWKMLPPQ